MERSVPRALRPVPPKLTLVMMVTAMPRYATFLRPVACPSCNRTVADYLEEPDGFAWVIPRRPPLHESLAPVGVTQFGLPPNFQEWTFTMRCECGATPSYSTSEVAKLAQRGADATPSPAEPGLMPARSSRRIRLPS
jgi:hypothetical protein